MKAIWLALVMSVVSGVAHADCAVKADNGWVRWVPPVSPNSAAYFTLHNVSDKAVDVVAAESDAARAVELHTVVKTGDLMQMTPVEKVAVAAGDKVEFKPGSYHVMLIDLKQPLEKDSQVKLTLRFADGESLQLALPVKDEGPSEDHSHHHHH